MRSEGGPIPNANSIVNLDAMKISVGIGDDASTPFVLYADQLSFFEQLAKYWRALYIDGTMFDGGDMVLSCRGVADNEFMVYFSENSADLLPLHAEFQGESDVNEEFVLFSSYKDESGNIKNLPAPLCILVASDILQQLEEEEIYDHLEFVIFNDDFPTPLIMAQLR